MENLPIAKESFPFLLVSGCATIWIYFYHPWISIFPGIIFLFIAFFFRNPQRKIILNEKFVLSPADGLIMNVSKVQEPNYLQEEVWKVTIFLSIFNVHFNRCPVSGTVEAVNYIPGKFLPAFKSHVSEINERNYVIFMNKKARIMVCQITGFIARRIVCWVRKGDVLKQGEHFGLIKFGSCTEIYLPLNCSIVVKKGDKVKGGLSVIGRLE